MIQLATCISQSHLPMLDLFLPTTTEFDSVDITFMPQVSATSHHWDGAGWGEQLRLKAHAMQDAARRTKEEYMLWSDVDVVFLQPCIDRLIELMNEGDGYDLLGQATGTGGMCAGFYVARMCHEMHHLLDVIVKDGKAYKNQAGDQYAMNNHRNIVRWGQLPVEEFWTPGWRGVGHNRRRRGRVRRSGHDPGWGTYGSVNDVHTPATARAVHANYNKGTELKLETMKRSLEQAITHREQENTT